MDLRNAAPVLDDAEAREVGKNKMAETANSN